MIFDTFEQTSSDIELRIESIRGTSLVISLIALWSIVRVIEIFIKKNRRGSYESMVFPD